MKKSPNTIVKFPKERAVVMNRDAYTNSVNLNINTDFPYLVLEVAGDQSAPRTPGFQVMHWHEDFQFIYVLDGILEVRTLDGSVQINGGEAIFINQNVVHLVEQIRGCHYNSFIFPAYFLEFYAGSPAKEFVDRVAANDRLPFVRIASADPWHGEITERLRQLAELERNKTDFYVYEVLVLLSTHWVIMQKHIAVPPKQKEQGISVRMRKMLRFIEEHYGEDLTLADLAASANISKSECSRCFRLCVNTTPCRYLTEYRLSKAAELLAGTDEPVGNIAAAVGFHQMSHFGKCFKEKTGCSPKAYRERNQQCPSAGGFSVIGNASSPLRQKKEWET